jgi:hypothetical protein
MEADRDLNDVFLPARELNAADVPPGIDRRAFMMRGLSSSHTIGPMRITYDFHQTKVAAMALTAEEMNAKYKETSKGGLAASVALC